MTNHSEQMGGATCVFYDKISGNITEEHWETRKDGKPYREDGGATSIYRDRNTGEVTEEIWESSDSPNEVEASP